MGAITFCPRTLLSFNKLKQVKFGKPIFSLGEIADWHSPFALKKNASIRSDGGGTGEPPRKDSAAGRKNNRNVNNTIPQMSDPELAGSEKKDEIIALFQRIQSSISKVKTERKTGSSKRQKPRPSSAKKLTDESVPDANNRARKKVKADTSLNKDGEVLQGEKSGPKNDRLVGTDEPVAEFKLTRLPSNFVKKSPIPSPSTPQGKVLVISEKSPNTEETSGQLKLPRVEIMKLPELKQIAKARGIKGYSRMKKSELVELLRS